MNILDTHVYKLRFHIDKDNAPFKYMKRWNDLKIKCENGENKHIIEKIKSYCKLNSNKEISYLDTAEGSKKITFRDFSSSQNDNDIILHEIINTDNEKWTYEELDDLMDAFIKTANFYIEGEFANGCIEMIKK